MGVQPRRQRGRQNHDRRLGSPRRNCAGQDRGLPDRHRLHQRRYQPVLQGQTVTSRPRGHHLSGDLPFDISGAIAAEIPAVDKLDQDPISTIKNGDLVEIDAPAVGEKATVTITRKQA